MHRPDTSMGRMIRFLDSKDPIQKGYALVEFTIFLFLIVILGVAALDNGIRGNNIVLIIIGIVLLLYSLWTFRSLYKGYLATPKKRKKK